MNLPLILKESGVVAPIRHNTSAKRRKVQYKLFTNARTKASVDVRLPLKWFRKDRIPKTVWIQIEWR